MAANELIALMRQVPIFQEFADDQLVAVLGHAERVMTVHDQMLIEEDKQGDAAFLLIEGDVWRLPQDDAEAEKLLEPGTLIGEMAMLIDTVHSVSVQAHGQAKLLKFSRPAMHRLMESNPRIAQSFLGVIAGRLSGVAAQMRAIDDELEQSEERLAQLSIDTAPQDTAAFEPA